MATHLYLYLYLAARSPSCLCNVHSVRTVCTGDAHSCIPTHIVHGDWPPIRAHTLHVRFLIACTLHTTSQRRANIRHHTHAHTRASNRVALLPRNFVFVRFDPENGSTLRKSSLLGRRRHRVRSCVRARRRVCVCACVRVRIRSCCARMKIH